MLFGSLKGNVDSRWSACMAVLLWEQNRLVFSLVIENKPGHFIG